jgi:hypothetical protein
LRLDLQVLAGGERAGARALEVAHS